MGVALKELGQLDNAIASFQTALKINPNLAEAHTNLGNILADIYNTGNVLLNNGKPDEAVESFRRALEIEPNLAEAHSNLGVALQELGQHENAVASYQRAIKIKPDYAEAHFNLGNAMKDLGQLDNAVASYRRALEIKPDLVEAHNNLGLALQELGQLDSAMVSYRRALEIKPGFIDALDNLLLVLNYTASHTPASYLEQARQFGRIVAEQVGVRFSAWQCAAHPERLRVGLVSGDLRKHSVGHFLEGLLARIDPARIELIAYPTHHREDELTARIRPYFSAWKPLSGLSDAAAARLIHADGVHVLIDLAGHTEHNRLPVFAWKPAPVQVTWLGLPTTTGVAEMDYVLGDPHAIPAEYANQFSEAVWRLPESYLCLTVPGHAVEVVPPPALSAGAVTFGSFNNLTKMTDAVVAVWARILKAVPGSRLLLKTKQLSELSVCAQTRQRFAACGIAPERLLLGGRVVSDDDHLAAYNKVDIALDTFPYPGVTTSVEALWMGVPVLSLQGDRFLSCTAASIAHNAGLPDWSAADEDDYVAKAVAFASDLERLAALRAGLRQQVLASPLFDAPRFARHFEAALWGMW
ncbi:MAG: tetratricopeptide repeat protein, partial [Gallionella sp.]